MPLTKIPDQLKKDIFEWDVYNWSKALDLWNHIIPKNNTLKCLEIGARSGGPSLWLALQGHKVICTDLDKPGLKAQSLHEKYEVSKQISYASLNALEIDYEDTFDLIIFKSVVGGISADGNDGLKKKVFEEINDALKIGGILLFAENLNGSFLHQFARKKFRKWGSSWNYMTLGELEDCLSVFKEFQIETSGFFSAFSSNVAIKKILGFLDYLLSPFIKKNMKYVSFGYAIKR